MSLRIYYSDKIEELAEHLKEKLVKEREESDPFSFSTVVVPNTNIAKWLRIRMFGETGGGIEQGAPEACLRPVLEDQLPALGLKEAVASSRRLVGKQE